MTSEISTLPTNEGVFAAAEASISGMADMGLSQVH